MEVNFIEASDKLKSALKTLEDRIGEIEIRLEEVYSYNEEFMNLVKIQRDLEAVKIIEPSDKLKSILEKIENRLDEIRLDEIEKRPEEMGLSNEKSNLVNIQKDLRRVEKLLIDVETGNLRSWKIQGVIILTKEKILGIFEYFSLGFLATAGIMIVGIFGERTQKVK